MQALCKATGTCITRRRVVALLQSLVSSRHRMMYSLCSIFMRTMPSTCLALFCMMLLRRPGAADMRPIATQSTLVNQVVVQKGQQGVTEHCEVIWCESGDLKACRLISASSTMASVSFRCCKFFACCHHLFRLTCWTDSSHCASTFACLLVILNAA